MVKTEGFIVSEHFFFENIWFTPFNSLPNNKILDLTKLKAINFADDKINVTQNSKFDLGWLYKIVGKKRKYWVEASCHSLLLQKMLFPFHRKIPSF